MVMAAESVPRVLGAQAEGGKVTRQGNGYVGEVSGGVHACEVAVGIDVLGPVK